MVVALGAKLGMMLTDVDGDSIKDGGSNGGMDGMLEGFEMKR